MFHTGLKNPRVRLIKNLFTIKDFVRERLKHFVKILPFVTNSEKKRTINGEMVIYKTKIQNEFILILIVRLKKKNIPGISSQ